MSSRLDFLRRWEAEFSRAGIDSPRLSAQVLLAYALGIPRLEMLLEVRVAVASAESQAAEALCKRRLCGEPVAYLVGFREFYGLEFLVNPSVLVPRPETELMVEFLEVSLSHDSQARVLDVGTGSGALAVTTAVRFPKVQVAAVDISRAALCVARGNAVRHGVLSRVGFFQGDLLQAIRVRDFDIILANLPYVPETRRKEMSREVLEYEPELALFAGTDGLDAYRRLANDLRNQVSAGCRVLCEIDCGQGDAIRSLFEGMAEQVKIVKDHAGLDRLAVVVF